MLTLQERKYYNTIETIVEESYKKVMETFDKEYTFKQDSDPDFDLSNATDYRNSLKSEDYTIAKAYPFHSDWRLVVARNGLMGWQHKKGYYHKIMQDIGWLQDACQFNDGSKGGLLSKNSIGFARGSINGVSYKVYANNTYKTDEGYGMETTTDRNGNQTTVNRFDNNTLNHDMTYTTDYVIANDITRNPNGRFDPKRLLRYSTTNRDFFKQFCLVWGRYCDNNDIENKTNTGFNEETDEYFIDIHNGPGIYSLVVQLDTGLTNGTINTKQINRDAWDSKYSGTEKNLYEWNPFRKKNTEQDNDYSDELEEIPSISYPDYDDNQDETYYNDSQDETYDNNQNWWDNQQQSDGDYPKKIDRGTGTISFGIDIPYRENDENNQEEAPKSLYNETVTVYFTSTIYGNSEQWIIYPQNGQWVDGRTQLQLGTVQISNGENNSVTFTLTNNNGNVFTFAVSDNNMETSRVGIKYANDIPFYYVNQGQNNVYKNQQVGYVTIKYTYQINQSPNNLFT